MPTGGGYWQLKAIADNQRAWAASYYALPPDSCPLDGSPLEVGSVTQSVGGKQMLRHCPMGNYVWSGERRAT